MTHYLLTLQLAIASTAIASAAFTETLTPQTPTADLCADYGADGKGIGNDSARLQKAIDDAANRGEGSIHIPTGTYRFANIVVRSNVHLLIDKDVTIYLFVDDSRTNITIFTFGPGSVRTKNVSIRGLGGSFTVVFPSDGRGYKFAVCQNVENFLIENFRVEDTRTKFSAISLNPYLERVADYAMPEDGTIRNGDIENANYGYGLIQAQAGKSIHFENLHGTGGVTLRLETGAKEMNDKQYGGVWDITGDNISCKDGHAAVMMGPHSMKNGLVKITNVRSEGCAFAVKAGDGFISHKQKNPNLEIGFFARGSYVKNIHAVFGTNAQLKTKDIRYLPEHTLKYVQKKSESQGQVGRGPSVTAVLLKGDRVEAINVSYEGFQDIPPVIHAEDILMKDSGRWLREHNLYEEGNILDEKPTKWESRPTKTKNRRE